MSFLDVVTHIEVASQSNTGPTGPSFDTAADQRQSEKDGYRRALSRSLNDAEKPQPTPSDDRTTADATNSAHRVDPNHRDSQADNLPQSDGPRPQAPQELAESEESPIEVQVVARPLESAEPPPNVVLPIEVSLPTDQLPTTEGPAFQPDVDVPQSLEPKPELVSFESIPEPPSSFQVTFEAVAQPQPPEVVPVSVDSDLQPLPPGGLFRVDQHQASPGIAIEVPVVDGDQPPAENTNLPEETAVETFRTTEASSSADLIGSAPEPVFVQQNVSKRVGAEVPSQTGQQTSARSTEATAALEPVEEPRLPAPPPQLLDRFRSGDQAGRAPTQTAAATIGPTSTVVQDVGAEPTSAATPDFQSTVAEGLSSVAGEVGVSAGKVSENGAVRTGEAEAAVRTTELVDRVTEMVRLGQQQNRPLRVRLHPPELGALQVEILSRDGAVTARLQVESQAAHRAIVESLSLLQDSLTNNGTVVDRIDVQLSPNLQDNRQSGLNRHGEDESGGSGREQQQRDSERDRRGDRSQSDSRGEPEDSDQIDIEV